MIEEEPEHQQEPKIEEEFDVNEWDGEDVNPLHWNHEPKRGGKKVKRESKPSAEVAGQEEKRKQKIEDKIFRKVVQ